MSGTNALLIGDIAEATFALEALRQGLIVSKPLSTGEVYDFIVDSGKRLYRVQVKSTAFVYIKNEKELFVQFQIQKSVGGARQSYTRADFDILACYVSGRNFWHFVHVSDIGVANTLRFHFAGNKPRDNWHIFK